ncbi:MAG: GlxA family transcriptional regulator [Paracoccus sp. (in: a-proteobacteria)]|uniref:GlxA family transcriptional regulator n=1 Tax=Paracoccus sp. TaxID=267 RepID=UPI0026E07680|nr:GlxA family transcriptional regulator [Paracoccus sp. (in: a-proteobacteria)]MDO5620397.1 GlxA family transcriptional regulator [Paracoccus sp. (in: a-proteobacteria)]
MTDTIRIGLLHYPAAQQAALLGLADLFAIAGQQAATTLPRLEVLHLCDLNAPRPEPLPDVIILPPSLAAPISTTAAEPLVPGLLAAHERGAVLASVCAGAFLLAETGLLNGRRATTHWAYTSDFAARFPKVELDADRLIVDEGKLITAGGMMAWTDLGLVLVDRLLGTQVMLATAQILLIDPPGREQRFYSNFAPRLNHGDAAILKVQHWLQDTDGHNARLPDLAARAGLEERTFLRRFQKATGMTSTEYAQRLRIDRARQILQSTTQPIDSIAWAVGYRDPAAFRKLFQRITGLTPGAYRRRFRAMG